MSQHEEDYQTLWGMFPHVDREKVKEVRDRCSGIDTAVDALLDLPGENQTELEKLQQMFPSLPAHTVAAELERGSNVDAAVEALLAHQCNQSSPEVEAMIEEERARLVPQATPEDDTAPTAARELGSAVVGLLSSAAKNIGTLGTTVQSALSRHAARSENAAAAPQQEEPAAPQQQQPDEPPATGPEPEPPQPEATPPEDDDTVQLEKARRLLQDLPSKTTVIRIVGKPGTGKTSILNAMLGSPLLPTKVGRPVNYVVSRDDTEDGEPYVVAVGDKHETVDLRNTPVFKVKESMEKLVKKMVEGEWGAATPEVRLTGPVLPAGITLRETVTVAPMDEFASPSDNGDVVVIVTNCMTGEEKGYFKKCAAQCEKKNVLLVRTVSPRDDPADVEDSDVLVVDSIKFLSSVLLSQHGEEAAYTGTFNDFKTEVHEMIQSSKARKEAVQKEVLAEVRNMSEQRISEWEAIRSYCTGVPSSDISRPPSCTDKPVTLNDQDPVASSSYAPKESTYQPPAPYVPSENDYMPAVSTWQPRA